MQGSAYSINDNSSILVSRNVPVGFIVGVAGFVGSHLADQLLELGIQVIGIDDFSTGLKINLEEATKNKKFHLINASISEDLNSTKIQELISSLPRVDYIFFTAETENDENSQNYKNLYTFGLSNFLQILKKLRDDQINKHISSLDSTISVSKRKEVEEKFFKDKPKVAFVSNINLYNNKLKEPDHLLKDAEIRFAKFVKLHKYNARVIRLAPIFGPRMHFRTSDPLVRLIQYSLSNNLEEYSTSMDFTTRSIYIADAIKLIIKSVLVGSTSNKIFDGALYQPIKISEVKQILLDPLWHETKGYQPTELPPWPTPNLERTIKELAWKPHHNFVSALKQTIFYFKERNISVNKVEAEILVKEEKSWEKETSSYISKEELKKWSFENFQDEQKNEKKKVLINEQPKNENKFNKFIIYIALLFIIGYGLVYPIFTLGYEAFNIRNHLSNAKNQVEAGEFQKAEYEIKSAKGALADARNLINSLSVIKKFGLLNKQIDQVDKIIILAEDGLSGVEHAIKGTQNLFMATKYISGEQNLDPKKHYLQANIELLAAKNQIEQVKSSLSEPDFIRGYPKQLRGRIEDLVVKLDQFSGMVDKAYTASILIPEITAIDGKKSYLVLLQNNLEIRPTGGFIGSYAQFDFQNGRLSGIKVDDIYNLDGGLKDVIEPPFEIKNDLGQNRLYLRDINFDPDFSTTARQAQSLYKKESGQDVHGVFALNLSGSANLLTAVGGVDLPEYSEHVDGSNLFEKSITHAEGNFFPGSQAKKNYLTSLQNQLFNKIFYLSKQNWPSIIQALSDNLEQKHLLIYLSDSKLFSYLSSQNWTGVIPRGAIAKDGQVDDFLAIVESNMGANKANYYLKRDIKMEVGIGKDLQIANKLTIDYANNSPSEVFPAGKYKNRIKFYLPLGAKITKAVLDQADITSQLTNFSDYGRTGYSVLIVVNPKEQKKLIVDYILPNKLNFKEDNAKYNLTVFKQPGTLKDGFDLSLTFPINVRLKGEGKNQEAVIKTDLLYDRSFAFDFMQR